MVARLAGRIRRLEQRCPPPESGCEHCRGHTIWPVDDDRMAGIADPDPATRARVACAFCGRRPTGRIKVIARSLWDAL